VPAQADAAPSPAARMGASDPLEQPAGRSQLHSHSSNGCASDSSAGSSRTSSAELGAAAAAAGGSGGDGGAAAAYLMRTGASRPLQVASVQAGRAKAAATAVATTNDHHLQPQQRQQPISLCGRVEVCTSHKCKSHGSLDTLAALQRAAAARPGVEVVASHCMRNCGQGPCVRLRVAGCESALLARHVTARKASALLHEHLDVVAAGEGGGCSVDDDYVFLSSR